MRMFGAIQGRRNWIIGLFIVFRILNAIFVVTYFNPDEFWQSLEIAHRIVFGSGFTTWEWSEQARIRGAAHPFIFVPVYFLLKLLGWDSPWMTAYSPRIIQAVLAAVGDVFLFKFARKEFGKDVAFWTIVCAWTNWFYFYCIVRTFSNSAETVFCIIAFYYWPWKPIQSQYRDNDLNRRIALGCAAIAVLMRPTSAIIWIFIGSIYLTKIPWKKRFHVITKDVLPIGIAAILFSLATDFLYYGKLTFVPWNFVRFNVLFGGSELYGTHSFHWYFSQGFPAMLGTLIFPFFIGIKLSQRFDFAIVIAWINLVYSFNAHKEFRFVLPALPIAFLYCGYALSWLSKRKKKFLRLPFKILMSLLFVPNLIAIVYFSRFHQLAPVEIALFLGNYGSSAFSSQFPLTSVHFWTGCHSTPYYSHIHRAISLRLFECEPRFSKDGTVSNEESESVLFLNHPVDFLEALYREFQQQPENSVGENCKNFNNKQDCLGHAGSICQWVNVTILGDLETFCMPIWMSFNQIAHATYLTDDRLRSISAIQREWADPFMSQKRFFSESYYPLSFEGEEISWRNSFWDKVTSSSELPSHIVIFEEHLASVHPILIRYGFSRIRSFLYSWFDLDSRYMYLYARGK